MKRRISFFAVIIIQSLLLSGCFDIYQHITKDSNGLERNTIKVTLTKALLEMGNSLGGSGSIDYDDIFEGGEIDVNSYNQFGAKLTKINSEFDVGFILDMALNYRDRNTANVINQSKESFIHKYNGKNMVIHVDCTGGRGISNDNEIAAAFFAAAKYRLDINKKCVANIKKVTIKANEKETEIDFLDLTDEYLIEIPMSILFLSAIDVIIYSA